MEFGATKLSVLEDKLAKVATIVPDSIGNRLGSISSKITAVIQSVILPGLTDFERRSSVAFVYQLLCNSYLLLVVSKMLQMFLSIENSLFLLSLASILPFMMALKQLFFSIPCPKMAALVSNSAILGLLVILILFCYSVYGNWPIAYIYTMAVWPWLGVASMVARLHIGRDSELLMFSPLTHLPFLGFLGAGSLIFQLIAIKSISVADSIILSTLDALSAAVFGPLLLGNSRSVLHLTFARSYALLVLLVALYFYETGTFSGSHLLFVFGRVLAVFRSLYVKYAFAAGTVCPRTLPESERIFLDPLLAEGVGVSLASAKHPSAFYPLFHRFAQFPSPVLARLDVIFDSGLCDGDYHALGPQGTVDLCVLTDFTYLLPLSSVASWLVEYSANATLAAGLLPSETVPRSAWLVAPLVCLFLLSVAVQPYAASRTLFDRGSAVTQWPSRIGLVMALFLTLDVLYLNSQISRLGVVFVLLALAVFSNYREALFEFLDRKNTVKALALLYRLQPSCLRVPQRRVLLEYLQLASLFDFKQLLLQTSINHGNNIKQLVKDVEHGLVWDPKPSATAAWKLAGSLVTKALRRQKQKRTLATVAKLQTVESIRDAVLECVDAAVDLADGHGHRLRLAFTVAEENSKRRVLAKLQSLVHAKKRQTLSLSRSVVLLASSGGAIRSHKDIDALPNSVSGNSPGTIQNCGVYSLNLPALREGHLPHAASVVLSFGDNSQSQLGVKTRTSSGSVVTVDLLRGLDFVSVAAGGSSSFALSNQGGIYAWGSNRQLELGLREELRGADSPMALKLLTGCVASQVATTSSAIGQAHTLVLDRQTGAVFGFGSQPDGALGLGEKELRSEAKILRFTSGTKIRQVACGLRHSLLLDETGRVWTFGDNRQGQLGQQTAATGAMTHSFRPLLVSGLCNVKLIACGDAHNLAVVESEGKPFLYGWGQNSCGQLGLGHYLPQPEPALVAHLNDLTSVVSVACGAQHSLVVADDGRRSFAFGSDNCGQLGVTSETSKALAGNSETTRCIPTLIHSVSKVAGRRIVQAAAAGSHSLLLDISGQVFAFGDNAHGQLGSEQKTVKEPTVVHALRTWQVRYIATSDKHSVCLATGN